MVALLSHVICSQLHLRYALFSEKMTAKSGQTYVQSSPPACLTGSSVPGHDLAVELQNLLLEPTQLDAEGSNTAAGDLGNALVASIGDDSKQLFNRFASH